MDAAEPGAPAPGCYRAAAGPRAAVPPGPDPATLTAARTRLEELHIHTPAYLSPALSDRFGREVWVKYETFLATGSFKLRGAIWAVEQAKARGASGIVTASTGNHGQGIAYAASRARMPVTVFVPEGTEAVKQRRMREFGAHLRTAGPHLSDAEAGAIRWAAETGATYIEDGESGDLMAGAASIGTEILRQVPGADTIIAPVGGGNLAAALCLAALSEGSDVGLVGAQSSAAAGVTVSWLRGELVRSPCMTLAGGLATERPGRVALDVLRHRLDLMCLVDEDDLWHGVRNAYDALGHNLELAAVAPLAALERFGDSIGGASVVVVASGSCIGSDQLAYALNGRTRGDWLERAPHSANEVSARRPVA
jgi:threonine dehydratase